MSTMNNNGFKSSLYPRAVDNHHQAPMRKNGADFGNYLRRSTPGITKTIEINGSNEDINESAEAFIQRFKQQHESPSSVVSTQRNKKIVPGDPTVMGRKKIERKASIKDINQSADAFIKRFKQQLQLQRLESIENYEKMLARGL